jgi:hypothetical protein
VAALLLLGLPYSMCRSPPLSTILLSMVSVTHSQLRSKNSKWKT